MNPVPEGQLTLEKFSALRKTRFRVHREAAHPVELELVEATPSRAGGPPRAEPAASFAFLFHGPPEPLLPQRTYPLEHERLGRFALFIVPVGRVSGAAQYQAVFNRLPSVP